jgi:hypothetical protein
MKNWPPMACCPKPRTEKKLSEIQDSHITDNNQ